MSSEQIPYLYALIIEYAIANGAPTPLNALPGCWLKDFEHDGRKWLVAINGHKEPKRVEPPETMGFDVPPFEAAVFCNGWIVASVGPYGGGCVGASEADVIAAIEAQGVSV